MRRIWMPLAALLAFVAAWAVFHAGKPRTAASPERTSDPATRHATQADAARTASKPQAKVEDRPLPPVDTPLGTTIGDLKRRADRGEAGAACRLAAEWTYCQGLRKQLQASETALRSQERQALRYVPGGTGARAGMTAERLERVLDFAQAQIDRNKTQLAHCDGVPVPKPDEITRYWRQAALAGHLPSMRNYAVGNAFRRDEVLDNLPALAVYRQEAVRIAREAVARGDLRAAIALAGAYSPQATRNRTYLSQLVEPDAGEALALSYRINGAIAASERSRVHQNVRSQLADMIEDLETAMSPEEIRAAKQRAADSPPLTAGFRDLQGLFTVADGFVADAPREECDLAAWSKDP